ncbi:MAG: hypothetical protein HQL95_01805 [Magnetococcales bacterium]|nr:hypothetical protein [Magnetococcales bacterium]
MSGGVVLALDLGTRTGWSVGSRETGQVLSSGTQNFTPRRFDGGGMRFLRFRHWLNEVKALTGFDEIHFEEVRMHVGVDAAHVYGGFLSILTTWGEEHGVPYRGIPVGTIKQHATGKGNASKEMMLTAMREKGHTPGDDNEADALAILHLALEQP